MNWAALFHEPADAIDAWSTPKGLIDALHAQGETVHRFPFRAPTPEQFPDPRALLPLELDVLLVFYAGQSWALERWMAATRLAFDDANLPILVVSELGDEPQTRALNTTRVQLSDLCLTPDPDCAIHWSELGARCHWFPHWADRQLFDRIAGVQRQPLIATTMGRRRYGTLLRCLFGRRFVNRHCLDRENTILYNTALLAFQYARWGELTRRIFEAAACGCCVVTNRLDPSKRLEHLFVDRESIVLYRHRFDLVLKMAYYLWIAPQKALAIGEQAQKIVLGLHTAEARASTLIQLVQDCADKVP